MSKFPAIKKKIAHFIENEDGNISKEKFLTTGLIISTLALTQQARAQGELCNMNPDVPITKADCTINTAHSNALSLKYETRNTTGQHDHCIERHSNHCSY